MSLKIPERLFSWLKNEVKRQIEGCKRIAFDGTVLYTPDGKGHYDALWTRDFSYMVKNAGDMMPLNEIENAMRYLFRGQRADGAMPDRVQIDGLPVYYPGGVSNPIGDPPGPATDNPQFMVKLTKDYIDLSGKIDFFKEFESQLARGLDSITLDENGLVYIDPNKPHSPYGFTDCIAKTGSLFFSSMLYWEACREISELYMQIGSEDKCSKYLERAERIEENIDVLWCDEKDLYYAARIDCRQLDIWGNAYAIYIGFPCRGREKIIDFLSKNAHRYLWRGQVRHLLKGQYWERLLKPVSPETYQNGAYWGTASGWIIYAIAQRNPDLASQIFIDLVEDYKFNGTCECVNIGYRKLPDYVVSATNPFGSIRRLIHERKASLIKE